jgi:hypothetical protein
VEAAAPLALAAGVPEARGEVRQTPDGLSGQASLQLPPGPGDAGSVILIVTVNDYPGGRAVQCMLQALGEVGDLSALTRLASQAAPTLLGTDGPFDEAGGPLVGYALGGGSGAGDGARSLRLSVPGFPPSSSLFVQVEPPRFAMLTLHRQRPNGAPGE